MLGRDIREPVNSHELHLRCEIYVQHQDRPLPVLFSWTTDEDGILKRIPLYNDRNSVPHGVGKYAWKVSPTESELVIEQVREADLKLYSCWVSIGNEVKSQNVTLIKKSKNMKIIDSLRRARVQPLTTPFPVGRGVRRCGISLHAGTVSRDSSLSKSF